MRERVASARSRGAARLRGYRLTLDKRSRDGSAKANLRPAADQWVHGVVYALAEAHWPDLAVPTQRHQCIVHLVGNPRRQRSNRRHPVGELQIGLVKLLG